jgi:hypothetical protein
MAIVAPIAYPGEVYTIIDPEVANTNAAFILNRFRTMQRCSGTYNYFMGIIPVVIRIL